MRKLVRISSIIIILAVGVFFSHQSIVQPQVASNADVQAEAQRGGYQLINMDELWQLYQQADNNLLLVDTRQEWEYYAGYIKGAVFFSMEPTWLARMTQRGALEQFLGPDKTKTLVFY
jgi:predicted sulfurtransferase